MSYIKSRKHPAMAVLAASLSLPFAAQAQGTQTLPEVNVRGERDVPFKADSSASPKMTQPLVDTPKTVQVIKKELIREQGATTLTEALRNSPGITLQLGENGNTSAGDVFQMRGFSTQTSTFVDGIRDLGPVTRDVFNYDAIEVVKGPSGSDIGRGASSGYINLISKLPGRDPLNEVAVTLGSAGMKRATADYTQLLGETSAVRLNAMVQDSGVPGRDVVENRGFAFAPSFAFGLNTPTRFYLYSQHQRARNIPDGGIPSIGMPGFFNASAALQAGERVNRENFYGSRSDYEKIDSDMVTAKIEHTISPGTTLRNITRYGRSSMDRVITGVNTLTAPNPADPSTWTVSRSRQRVDQENDILANQTSLNTAAQWLGVRHDLSTGIEVMYERQLTLGAGTAAQTINGVAFPAVAQTPASVYSPNPDDNLGTPYHTGANTEGKTMTLAGYAFDTVTLNDAWKVNGGLRFERYTTTSNIGTIVTATNAAQFPGYTAGQIAPTNLEDADNLLSWNLGAVYKPAPNGSLYAAVANSYTPPGSANLALSGTASNQSNPSLDPQETKHYELGTKWDLIQRRLSTAVALFRTTNDKQASFDDLGNPVQFGKTQVSGIELTAVGQITPQWQVTAGVVRMNTKQAGQQNAAGVQTTGVRWSPDLAASLWTSYTVDRTTFGGGVRYVGEQKRHITDATTPQNMPEIPSYAVFDLMAGYRITKQVDIRFNLYNVFDKLYIASLNNSGARMLLGQPRSFAVTARMMF